MKTPFNIFKPRRRICPNKSTKYPVTEHDPALWLKSAEINHTVFGVDGFVVDKHGAVSAIMSRFEFEGAYINREHVVTDLLKHYAKEIKSEIELSQMLNVPYRLFLWPKDYPISQSTEVKEIIVFFPKLINQSIDLSEAKKINLSGLVSGIKKYRGREYKSVKSLSSANSNLECYLANKTNNPWPGDIDGILIDNLSRKVEAIIEYKTHNIDSPIQNEFIGKYGKQDWRRFEVLYKLQSAIEQAQTLKPKLFYIVWGSQNIENHLLIKIDCIDKGKVINTSFITRPKFGLFSEELLEIFFH